MAAGSKTGTVEIAAGTGISLAADTTTKKVTITATGEAKATSAGTADKLATARTIAISGGATGTATSFDGSANITVPITALDPSKISGTVPAGKLPAATASAQGAVMLDSSTGSTSTTKAATASAVKAAYDKAAAAQTAANSKSTVLFAAELPTAAPAGTVCFITV